MRTGERNDLGETARQSDERELVISHLQELLLEREKTAQVLQSELNSITRSAGWTVFQKLWGVYERSRLRAFYSKVTSRLSTLNKYYARSNGSHFTIKVADEAPSIKGADVRAVAFYLPQFHPINENDQWWGKGFTEWTNVTKARPNFEGHYQPHLPAELGFYDLRVPEVREQQAELAREYGIHGFCYYHYWFGGRRLLERPFNEVLSNGRPDFPFCLCWANENWTRRWDGAEKEILIGQRHSPEDDRDFIRSLFPAFEDRRYIRINGKPILLVYRVDLLPNTEQTATTWREEMKNAGLGGVYLCAAQTHSVLDPRPYGFDGAVEFPPHGMAATDLNSQITGLNPNFAGLVRDYLVKANAMIHKPKPDYTVFKTVMPAWDNTARRQDACITYINSSPEAYEYWLGKAVEYAAANNRGDERLVFINAWNEWAEGAHLEPDRRYGRRYLEATRNVLSVVRGK